MKTEYAIAGIIGFICLLIVGIVCADSITSNIVCDGATWVSSSVLGQGQTYAASIFTTNLATLLRELQVGSGGITSGILADSAGPMGIDEYSGQATNSSPSRTGCVFDESENRTMTKDQIMYSGLMRSGMYASTRKLGSSETSSTTMINGSGMILVRASSKDQFNETSHSSDVAGSMNMTERIVFGEEQ